MIRRLCALMMGIWLTIACAVWPAAAQEIEGLQSGEPVWVEETQEYPPPYTVLLRSAAFPGWGQLENEQNVKAALFMVLEGGLAAASFVEFRRADRSFELHVEASEAGDQEQSDLHLRRYEERRARGIERIWWASFTVLISMIDAYVDAHLRDFVETKPMPELAVSRGLTTTGQDDSGAELATLALKWTF